MDAPHPPDPLPKEPVVVILGPTAVGKSAVAVEVAIRAGGEVISADSRAFFRGLDIATDKPSFSAQRGVPHHLIGVIDVDEHYDAMAFRHDADRLIQAIQRRHRIPILVGGGTLYLGAILRGLFVGPSADRALRKELSRQPTGELYLELGEVDPLAAEKIHPNDRLRIIRAMEVYKLAGRPISELQREAHPLPYRFVVFGLRRNKDEHRAAIIKRCEAMLDGGLLGEMKQLRERGLNADAQAYRTIGVREGLAFLDGKISQAKLQTLLVRNTWRLVRRQMAWFRKEKAVTWIDVTGRAPGEVAAEIVWRLNVTATSY